MLSKDTLELIKEKVKEILEPLAFELVELKYIHAGENIILRLLVDRVEGGISIDECSGLNSKIGQFLEENNIISDRYILEVSSPGLDRPLIESKDFRRVLNKRIHLFLNTEHKGKVELEGGLIKLDNEGITIIDNDNREEYIQFSEINRAKQVIL